jgi:hypothetical protein
MKCSEGIIPRFSIQVRINNFSPLKANAKCHSSGQNLRPRVLAIRCFAVSMPFLDFLICDDVNASDAGDESFDVEMLFAFGVTPRRDAAGEDRNGDRDAPSSGESTVFWSNSGCCCCCGGGGFLTVADFFFGVILGFRRRSAANFSPISTAVTFFAPSREGRGSTFPATFLTRTFGLQASSFA